MVFVFPVRVVSSLVVVSSNNLGSVVTSSLQVCSIVVVPDLRSLGELFLDCNVSDPPVVGGPFGFRSSLVVVSWDGSP